MRNSGNLRLTQKLSLLISFIVIRIQAVRLGFFSSLFGFLDLPQPVDHSFNDNLVQDETSDNHNGNNVTRKGAPEFLGTLAAVTAFVNIFVRFVWAEIPFRANNFCSLVLG